MLIWKYRVALGESSWGRTLVPRNKKAREWWPGHLSTGWVGTPPKVTVPTTGLGNQVQEIEACHSLL